MRAITPEPVDLPLLYLFMHDGAYFDTSEFAHRASKDSCKDRVTAQNNERSDCVHKGNACSQERQTYRRSAPIEHVADGRRFDISSSEMVMVGVPPHEYIRQ